jgi:hypothetical protein
MGITYNKNFQTKDRLITHSGPRDRQLRQANQVINSDQSLLIEELRSQISKLQEQLENKTTSNVGYTAEQVDSMMIETVKSETENLKNLHIQEKNHLHNVIESKDEIIKQLKENQNNSSGLTEERIVALLSEATKNLSFNSGVMIKNDRPRMEIAFVDPIEKEIKSEKHFVIEETPTNEKVQLDDKVNKLKGLLGKLPSKIN